jgi:tRNA(fMet)-specific endonuclease VapC
MFLLDTDTLVFVLRGESVVARNLRDHADDPKAISVITYAELLYGAEKSARPVENAGRVRQLAEVFPVIDVTPAVVETFASLKADLESEGTRLDDFDLVIAATAINLNYTLVTNNTRHFRLVPGLTVENWAERPHDASDIS